MVTTARKKVATRSYITLPAPGKKMRRKSAVEHSRLRKHGVLNVLTTNADIKVSTVDIVALFYDSRYEQMHQYKSLIIGNPSSSL